MFSQIVKDNIPRYLELVARDAEITKSRWQYVQKNSPHKYGIMKSNPSEAIGCGAESDTGQSKTDGTPT